MLVGKPLKRSIQIYIFNLGMHENGNGEKKKCEWKETRGFFFLDWKGGARARARALLPIDSDKKKPRKRISVTKM